MKNLAQENGHQLELEDLLTYLDGVIQSFEDHPDAATREAVFGMLQALDALHREALRRLLAFLSERDADQMVAEAAERDRVIHTVLGLYELLPADEAAVGEVESALARVLPYVESHGGSLEVLYVSQGVVHLAMGGACRACPGAQITLERGVRRALETGYPEFEELVVHEPEGQVVAPAAGLIRADEIQTSPAYLQAPRFQTVARRDGLRADTMQQVEVDGTQVLLVDVAGEIYALAGFCPGTMLPLAGGDLVEMALVCPWHGERFDVRSGRRVDDEGQRRTAALPIYPVAVRGDAIQVAVNVPARPPLTETADGG